MQRQLSFSDSEDAISPIIGTVLILAIMVSITGTMLAWGIPQIQESEAYAIYTSAQNNFLNFDADLDQVIVQGEGSSRSSTVSFSAGTFVHRENLDEIRYYYETTSWSSFEILGVKNGATTFAIIDNKGVIDDFDLTIFHSFNAFKIIPFPGFLKFVFFLNFFHCQILEFLLFFVI